MPQLAEGGGARTGCPPFFAKETRRDAPLGAARFASSDLMPPGCGLTIPRLNDVPLEHQLWQGEQAAARLARTLLEAEIAQAHDWALAKGNAFAFVKRTLERWLCEHHDAAMCEQFFLDVTLSTSLDRYTAREEGQGGVAHVYLTVEPESAGYVVLGPTLRLLDAVHPRFPATFADRFPGALNRWVRVYDYRDAQERIEMVREWYESDPEAEQVELPDIERSIPDAMRKQPLGDRTLRQLMATTRNPLARQLMERAMELDRLSNQGKRPEVGEDVRELLMDCGEPVPALVAVFEANDTIEGAFDEERHGMLEVTPEPNVLIPFNGEDAASASEAFSVLAILCETLACASSLIGIMPGQPRQMEEAR